MNEVVDIIDSNMSTVSGRVRLNDIRNQPRGMRSSSSAAVIGATNAGRFGRSSGGGVYLGKPLGKIDQRNQTC